MNSVGKKELDTLIKAEEYKRKLREAAMQVFDGEAYQRLTNVKIANPTLYIEAVKMGVYLSKRYGRKLTDKELVEILTTLTEKREGSIEIKRK